jgi:hypothetical protein
MTTQSGAMGNLRTTSEILTWLASRLDKDTHGEARLLKELLAEHRRELQQVPNAAEQRSTLQQHADAKGLQGVEKILDAHLAAWEAEKSSGAPESTGRSAGGGRQTDPIVRDLIPDARLLIAYSAERDIDVEVETVKTILDTERAVAERSLDADEEVAFWGAFRALAGSVRPATVASIQESRQQPESRPSWLTKRTSRRYRWGILAGLTAMLLVHIFFVVVNGYVTELDRIRNEFNRVSGEATPAMIALEAERIRQEEAAERQGSRDVEQPSTDEPQIPTDEVARYVELERQIEMYNLQKCGFQDQWDSNIQLLRPWVRLGEGNFLDWLVPSNYEATESRAPCQIRDLRQIGTVGDQLLIGSARSQITTVAQFFLPLLYGWVGALAYILRTLASELRAATFSKTSSTEYTLRWPLGMLAGVAIGLLLQPQTLTGLAALTPLGVAFIAGYSVELLFTFLDRLVRAFSEREPPPAR